MKQAEEHYRAALTFQELNRLSEAANELNRAVELIREREVCRYPGKDPEKEERGRAR